MSSIKSVSILAEPEKEETMKYFSLTRAVVPALLLMTLLTVNSAAQRRTRVQPQPPRGSGAIEQTIKKMNGTWILQRRINPDGSEHAKPLYGETTFNLSSSSAHGMAFAIGTFSSRESGAMDLRSSSSSALARAEGAAALERQQKTFEVTAEGRLEVRTNSTQRALTGPDTVQVIYPSHTVKGNYGVFREGVVSERLVTNYRVTPDRTVRTKRAGRLATTTQSGTLSLAGMEHGPSRSMSTNAKELRGPGDAEDPSHMVVSLVVRGNRMDVKYGNGTRDIWIRRTRQ